MRDPKPMEIFHTPCIMKKKSSKSWTNNREAISGRTDFFKLYFVSLARLDWQVQCLDKLSPFASIANVGRPDGLEGTNTQMVSSRLLHM